MPNPWINSFQHEKESGFSTLHRSYIGALIIVILLALAARHTNIKPLDPYDGAKVTEPFALEAIITKKQPPPPPKTAPPPKTIQPPPPDIVPEVITTKIKPIPKPPRRKPRRTRDVKADFNLEADGLFAEKSTIGEIDGPNAKNRRKVSDNSPRLGSALGGLTANFEAPADLDLNVDGPNAQRNQRAQELDLKIDTDKNDARKAAQKSEGSQVDDLINADVSVVLTSTDLSMGAEAYQLWNRINAEFDRWDKGRYGALPIVLQRKGRSMVAVFDYAGGVGHRIVWGRGNTKIYVVGESTRNRVEEIALALNSLVQLNIKTRGF